MMCKFILAVMMENQIECSQKIKIKNFCMFCFSRLPISTIYIKLYYLQFLISNGNLTFFKSGIHSFTNIGSWLLNLGKIVKIVILSAKFFFYQSWLSFCFLTLLFWRHFCSSKAKLVTIKFTLWECLSEAFSHEFFWDSLILLHF